MILERIKSKWIHIILKHVLACESIWCHKLKANLPPDVEIKNINDETKDL